MMMMMMMMMMRRFVERVINSPQTRCRSAKQVGLQMSSELITVLFGSKKLPIRMSVALRLLDSRKICQQHEKDACVHRVGAYRHKTLSDNNGITVNPLRRIFTVDPVVALNASSLDVVF